MSLVMLLDVQLVSTTYCDGIAIAVLSMRLHSGYQWDGSCLSSDSPGPLLYVNIEEGKRRQSLHKSFPHWYH
jgi:hypothetical protein